MTANIAPTNATYSEDSEVRTMMLNEDQMKRQTSFEVALHYVSLLYEKGIISYKDYRREVLLLESEICPVIKHNSLLIKE